MAGVALIKEEIRVLKRIRLVPEGDRFVDVMEVRRVHPAWEPPNSSLPLPQTFLPHATGAIDALREMSTKLSEDLDSLLLYYGEDPKKITPEEFFATIVGFSSAMAVSRIYWLDI